MSARGSDPGLKPRRKTEQIAGTSQQSVESSVDEQNPESFRDLTKEEVLHGIAEGYHDFVVGNYKSAEDCYDELGWHESDDAT